MPTKKGVVVAGRGPSGSPSLTGKEWRRRSGSHHTTANTTPLGGTYSKRETPPEIPRTFFLSLSDSVVNKLGCDYS